MNDVKMLERKVNLLIDYVTAPENAFGLRVSILNELRDLRSLKSGVLESSPEKSVKYVTENLLTEIGIPTRLSGYTYLVTAVPLIVENPGMSSRITKELYPKIAEVHSLAGYSSRVERAIRHAIEVAWERGDVHTLHSLFGNALSPDKGKPTNTEFMCRLAQLVQREMGTM